MTTTDPIDEAGARAARMLAADTEFAQAVSRAEINRLITVGKLIPAERLMLGPGLELTPAGRLARLEAAVTEAIGFLDTDDAKVDEALIALMAAHAPLPGEQAQDTQPEPEPDGDADEPAPTPRKTPAKKAPAKTAAKKAPAKKAAAAKKTGARSTRIETKSASQPSTMPNDPDTEYRCGRCQTVVDLDVAKLSYIRTRMILCRNEDWSK